MASSDQQRIRVAGVAAKAKLTSILETLHTAESLDLVTHDDLVIIVMELLRSNQELEFKLRALGQTPNSGGTLRERIKTTFRKISGLGDVMEGNLNLM